MRRKWKNEHGFGLGRLEVDIHLCLGFLDVGIKSLTMKKKWEFEDL